MMNIIDSFTLFLEQHKQIKETAKKAQVALGGNCPPCKGNVPLTRNGTVCGRRAYADGRRPEGNQKSAAASY